jgi:hypothetical protein
MRRSVFYDRFRVPNCITGKNRIRRDPLFSFVIGSRGVDGNKTSKSVWFLSFHQLTRKGREEMFRWIYSLSVGFFIGLGVYMFLVTDVFLSISFAICWSVIMFNFRNFGSPKARYASGMLILIATFGVSGTLGIPKELLIAFRLLVLSAGWASISLCVSHDKLNRSDSADG